MLRAVGRHQSCYSWRFGHGQTASARVATAGKARFCLGPTGSTSFRPCWPDRRRENRLPCNNRRVGRGRYHHGKGCQLDGRRGSGTCIGCILEPESRPARHDFGCRRDDRAGSRRWLGIRGPVSVDELAHEVVLQVQCRSGGSKWRRGSRRTASFGHVGAVRVEESRLLLRLGYVRPGGLRR